MSVSVSRINQILKAWEKSPAGKARIKETVDGLKKSGAKKTAAGSELVTPEKMKELAEEFISILTLKAMSYSGSGDGSIPGSVLAHFSSLYYEGPFEEPDGSYTVHIKFGDDLSRPSLERGDGESREGIGNIVALFNNGMHAEKGYAYGWWHGHAPSGGESVYRSGFDAKDAYIRSVRDRQGTHFVQDAIKEFEERYGRKFGATADPDVIYTYAPGSFPK